MGYLKKLENKIYDVLVELKDFKGVDTTHDMKILAYHIDFLVTKIKKKTFAYSYDLRVKTNLHFLEIFGRLSKIQESYEFDAIDENVELIEKNLSELEDIIMSEQGVKDIA